MEEQKFKPTSEWMQENYNKLNNELFDGELGGCILRPFTSGKGAGGRTLGWFKITGNSIKVERQSRRIFLSTPFGKEYINANNFVNYCKPAIELNANYLWSEKAMQSTLLHEMCHYYTYMKGFAPKQGHGPEFYAIGRRVSAKSNGLFPVERLASSEEMNEMQLTDEMVAKKTKNGSYLICFTLSSPYRYSPTKIYNYGYTKVQTKQALEKWKDYTISHAKDFSSAELYTANNLQAWSQLSRCNIGRYYLVNNIDEIKEKYGLQFESNLLERDEELEKKKANKDEILKIGYKLCNIIYYGKNYNEDGDIITNKGTVNINDVEYNISTTKNAGRELLTWRFDDYGEDAIIDICDGDLYRHVYFDELTNKDYMKVGKEALRLVKKYGALTSPSQQNNTQTVTSQAEPQSNNSANNTIPLFRLNLGNKIANTMVNNNNTFELRNVTKDEIKLKLKERFPKMSDETIEKLMNNPANYPQNENRNPNAIVENVLNNFLLKEFNIETSDAISIDPNMNLGLESPFEQELY